MMLRRRTMGGGRKEESYIQNGLAFWLDGINKGDDATAWTDLIGGVKFAYNSHSIVNTDNVEMDGNSYIKADTKVEVGYDVGTIEAALYVPNTNGGVIFYSGALKCLALIQAGTGIAFANCYSNTINNQYNISDKLLNNTTISISNDHIMRDMSELSGSKVGNGWNPDTYTSIGGRTQGTQYPKAFKMFSLRIYNRKLTVAEMLHNQQVDNQRFNLGLNI